jgi:chaperonin cofactor prefoldin
MKSIVASVMANLCDKIDTLNKKKAKIAKEKNLIEIELRVLAKAKKELENAISNIVSKS